MKRQQQEFIESLHMSTVGTVKRRMVEPRARTKLGAKLYNELMLEFASSAIAAKKNSKRSYNKSYDTRGPKYADVSAQMSRARFVALVRAQQRLQQRLAVTM